ncbi:MAG: 4Fe-4S binding protein [Caldisericia bacterium]
MSMVSLTHMYGRLGFGWPGNSAGSLDCYCPFGGLETLPTFLTSGKLVAGVDFNDIILLGVLLTIILVFSSGFCSYLCPLGSVSEWIYKLRKLIFKKEIRVSKKLSSILSWGRYLVLAFLLIMTTVKGYLVFTQVDPYRALLHFGHEWTPTLWVVMMSLLVLSLLFERPFCNYLCPLGGAIGAVSCASLTKVKRNEKSCIDCKKCDSVCPMNLTPSRKVELHRCIMCGKCVAVCPVDNTLNIEFAGKAWK